GQGAENIEDGAHTQRRAHGAYGLHRRVVVGRKQEGEVAGGQASAGLLLVEGDFQAQGFEHIGAAGSAGIERLPCLTTGMSQAAVSNAVPVEMFKLPEASPPVPTTSMARRFAGMFGRRA